MENQIEIYQSQDGIVLNVQLSNETVWLSQDQLTLLFERDQSVISRHLSNVFKERELNKESNMQKLHIANSDKPVTLYSLDVIISVGYRVKSIRGTQFRQWATKRLKDFLVEGVAINEKRLAQKNKEIQVLHDGIRILSRAIEEKASSSDLKWLKQFSLGLQLLDDYDHELLDSKGNNTNSTIYPSTNEYARLVKLMQTEFKSNLFGREKDGGFDSAVNQIRQSFGKQEIYPSIEEKAAMLLYLIVKNHAFVDGNKRIAAACFLLFLSRNKMLYSKNEQTIISNEALASITLFVAASKSEEIETVKRFLISVLKRKRIAENRTF
jgi:prophage maintenance system killer protein